MLGWLRAGVEFQEVCQSAYIRVNYTKENRYFDVAVPDGAIGVNFENNNKLFKFSFSKQRLFNGHKTWLFELNESIGSFVPLKKAK